VIDSGALEIPMRINLFLITLFASAVIAKILASPLILTNPIGISGGGSIYSPDCICGISEGITGSIGYSFGASGSNGTDTVSISVLDITGAPIFTVIGQPVILNEGICPLQENLQPYCTASIDGISGAGGYTALGGGLGMIFVYSDNLPFPPLTLLAEAEVYSVGAITSIDNYTITGCMFTCPAEFFDEFTLSSTPEPSTLCSVGLALCFWGFAAIHPRTKK
jgi:hypothetical protein